MSDTDQKIEVPETQEVTTSTPNHIIVTLSDDKRGRWYVVHTYSGHENKVAETLKQRAETMGLTNFIHEMLVPTQEKIQIKRGKKQAVREKIFPGYMLIKMILTDESWLLVRTTQGVTGFVGTGTKPIPLAASEVATIQKYLSQGSTQYKANFEKGEAVRIVEGPFADFLGTVSHIDESKGKVTVLVSIFGRETPVELDFLQVSKL
jgi:transcriptional antiterminator NusG